MPTPHRRSWPSGGAGTTPARWSTISPTPAWTPASSATSTRTSPSTPRRRTPSCRRRRSSRSSSSTSQGLVEEFILDQTLAPAIVEFGLPGLKIIDPTCGSGHFLLGAFARLNAEWQQHSPNLDPRSRVQKALDSIHGVDLNPFAVAIARFRLTVAALQAAGERSLTDAPAFTYHLAIGDSLLGEQGTQEALDLLPADGESFEYASEDLSSYHGILEPGRYHVVVGNPPYPTVKDKALNGAYRRAYPMCSGKYALTVPFMELFFRLARREGSAGGAGYVGKITANSFMKREFGKKLIEVFLAGKDISSTRNNPVDLTGVIDTSGAYIPGHGTPTVILTGRPRRPATKTVRAVLGVRGEPGPPADASKGLVWSEIAEHFADASYDGQFVTVRDLDRAVLGRYPWSLSGGGASDIKELVEAAAESRLADAVESIGFAAITGDDDIFVRRIRSGPLALSSVPTRRFVEGDRVRDFSILGGDVAVFPYPVETAKQCHSVFWPFRAVLRAGLAFGQTREDRGDWWGEYILPNGPRLSAKLLITFAFVATHNHFVLDRGGKVFNRSAPVIKLPADATESDHLALLATLNSSTACFWLKQVSHNKGEGGGARVDAGYAAMGSEGWKDTYEFTGTKLQEFPLVDELPEERGRRLDALSTDLKATTPTEAGARIVADGESSRTAGQAEGESDAPAGAWRALGATKERPGGAGASLSAGLSHARREWNQIRAEMIAEQEELDWETYYLYSLTPEDLSLPYDADPVPLALGERAFEIALARKIAAGEEESAWFERHGSTPITELPAHWPAAHRDLVERRLARIESDPFINLLERPEYKRRWATVPWEKQQEDALRAVILDRLEAPNLWRDAHGATTRSIAQLADAVRNDAILREAVQLLAGRSDVELAPALSGLLADEAVPFLAAYRYKESGLTKYREWQRVWDLQRAEDRGEAVTIPVPPKYAQADFRKASFWKARGKLDVPKERFIAYPGVTRPGDSTPVLGWAGWDHADQALALARLTGEQLGSGADADAATPLLAGLAELEPWLHQWHNAPDPSRGAGVPAAAITGMLDQYTGRFGLTREDLDAWTPQAAARGRRSSKR